MSWSSFGADLVLLVCLELPLLDILSLRRVNSALYNVTKTKALWIYLLQREILRNSYPIPPYLRQYDLLGCAELEALVWRASRLARRWESNDLSPARSCKIACWDVAAIFQGCTYPVVEAYLPGRVKTAKLEVQQSSVIIALGLGSESLSVHVITLRKQAGRYSFLRLCEVDGSSHVLMLCGDLVGCAIRDDAIVPHLINWKQNRVFEIPSPPSGLDIPGRRNVPHLMTICKDTPVILRAHSIELYSLSLVDDLSIVFAKQARTPQIWDAAACTLPSESWFDTPSFRLLAMTPAGIAICDIAQPLPFEAISDLLDPTFRFAQVPPCSGEERHTPWFRLCSGETGRLALCIAMSQDISDGWHNPPRLLFTSFPTSSTELLINCSSIACNIEGSDAEQLALWAIPIIDFDEALGFTVVGNAFGELAIYDHAGVFSEHCVGLGIELMADQTNTAPAPSLLPTSPIQFLLPNPPTRSSSKSDLLNNTSISQWSQDILALDSTRWLTDWVGVLDYCGYRRWDKWSGEPGDHAWLIEHVYGFPAPIFPQAWEQVGDQSVDRVLVRSGQRYLAFTWQSDDELRSWPLLVPPIGDFDAAEADVEAELRCTARTEGTVYMVGYTHELFDGRDRKLEMAERAGSNNGLV